MTPPNTIILRQILSELYSEHRPFEGRTGFDSYEDALIPAMLAWRAHETARLHTLIAKLCHPVASSASRPGYVVLEVEQEAYEQAVSLLITKEPRHAG